MRENAALIRSLLLLRSERRTGVLTVSCEGVQTFVYLKSGVPVFAEEGTHGETLGRLLVRQKVLSQQQYATIIGKMTDALVLNEQLRFGEIAVELGYLTEQQVTKALFDQIRWKMIRVFQRPNVTWSFEDSESRVDDVGSFPMRIEALVLDAVRWVDDDEKRELALAGALDKTARVEDAAELVRRFELSAEEAAFVRVLDGRTLEASLASKEAAEVDAPAILTALVVTRAVQVAGEPRLARPNTPIIEIRLQAGPVAAAPAREKPAAAAPPPASPAPPPARARPQITRASAILQALEAQRVKPDAQRAPASEHEAKLLAERAFQDALVLHQAGRHAQAAPEFARASQLLPQSDEYRLHARWSAVRARSEEPHPQDRSELRRLAHAALKADPNLAFAHFVAGAMALDEGDDVHAYRFLVRAVKLDPQNLEAQRQLRMAERRVRDRK